jgi:hypothetical protein
LLCKESALAGNSITDGGALGLGDIALYQVGRQPRQINELTTEASEDIATGCVHRVDAAYVQVEFDHPDTVQIKTDAKKLRIDLEVDVAERHDEANTTTANIEQHRLHDLD